MNAYMNDSFQLNLSVGQEAELLRILEKEFREVR